MSVLALALVLLLAVPAAAAELPVVKERLGNGLTVLVRENPTAPVVAVSLMVRMGTRWEMAENAGISNFVQAVMVKGTKRQSGGVIAEKIASMGGKVSANGDVDFAEIRGTALARFWRELLGLTAELALEPARAPAELDVERDELLTSIQKRQDNPSSRAFDTFFATLYDKHPYGLPTLGLRASLPRIDHQMLVSWYRTFYRPERMVLAVSGQVPTTDVLAEAKRLFGSAPALPDAAADDPRPRPVSRGQRVVVEQPAQQTQILMGSLGPGVADGDYATAKVLSTVLGGGLAGRLFSELRDTQALAYTVSAYFDPVREPGAFLVYMGTAPENATRAERALAEQIERIRTEPVGAEELARAKAYLLGSFTMDRRTNARQAYYLAFFETVGVGYDFPARYRKSVEAVTAEDVLRVAKTYLQATTTVVLQPPRKR
jgi:predicted Zn-dependent peptidase